MSGNNKKEEKIDGHIFFLFYLLILERKGALLLVDASQGVQAQTFAAYDAAIDLGVTEITQLKHVFYTIDYELPNYHHATSEYR